MSDHNDFIDTLIMLGAVEVSGIDSQTGEFLYTITPKIKDLMPEMYDEHLKHVNSEIMALWEAGFVDIDFTEDNPVVFLSQKSQDEQQVAQLPNDLQWSLREIKRHIMG